MCARLVMVHFRITVYITHIAQTYSTEDGGEYETLLSVR